MGPAKTVSKNYFIYLLFLLSGFSGLIYEILWVQVLSLIFGVSYIAVTTIVSAYMAGMGLGAFALRKYIDRSKNPLKLYALCELGIGIFFFFFLRSVPLLKQVFIYAHRYFGGDIYLFSILRFAIVFVFLLVPTMLMGATLPALTRCLSVSDEEKGKVISILYGLNTLGATIGCFLSGFVLIGTYGIPFSNNIALFVTFSVAVIGYMYSRRVSFQDNGASAEVAVSPQESGSGDGISRRVILLAFFISGFTALSFEILWSRIIIFHFGYSDIHAFSTILSSYLIGIGIGSLIFDRVNKYVRNGLNILMILELLIGVLGFVSYMLYLNFDLFLPTGHMSGNAFFKTYLVKFAISLALMLPATLIYGFIFPLFNQLYKTSPGRIGVDTGTAYFVNTFGSIAGSLTAGFFFIPFAGLKNGIIITGLLNIMTVFLLAGACIQKFGKRRFYTMTIAAGVFFALILPPFMPFRPLVKVANGYAEVLYYREGVGATVTVINDILTKTKYLYVNSAPVAFSNYSDLEIQVSLAQFPLIFKKNPSNMLIIGFGSGTTSGSARRWDRLKNLTCVELEKHEKDTAYFFRDRNYNIISDPDFKIIINDGRNHLLTTGDTYDVISRDTLLPAQSVGLYTKDFYELCRKRLGGDGVFCGYIPMSSMEDYYFRSTVKTVSEVFRNVTLWWVNQESMIVMGTDGSLDLDYERISSLFEEPLIRAEFERINMKSPEDLLARYIIGAKGFGSYFNGISPITDYKPIIINSSNISRELPKIVKNLLNAKDPEIPAVKGLSEERKAAVNSARALNFRMAAAKIKR